MLTATLTATPAAVNARTRTAVVRRRASAAAGPSGSGGWREATRPPLRPQGRYRVADATALRAALGPGDLYGPLPPTPPGRRLTAPARPPHHPPSQQPEPSEQTGKESIASDAWFKTAVPNSRAPGYAGRTRTRYSRPGPARTRPRNSAQTRSDPIRGRDDRVSSQATRLPAIDAGPRKRGPAPKNLTCSAAQARSVPSSFHPYIRIRFKYLTATVTATQAHNHDRRRTRHHHSNFP